MSQWRDLATWRGPTRNQGGAMVEHRGLVVHIAEGSFEGTISWQKNPTAQVSSHFVVDTDGKLAQVVDTDVTAWTQRAGNGHWLSVECAGHTPHALTSAQVESIAKLLARAHKQYGVPLQLATSPSGRGLGHHSMGHHPGFADDWGHSDCPGPAIIAQKPAILARAVALAAPKEDDDMTPAQSNQLDDVWHILTALAAGATTAQVHDHDGRTSLQPLYAAFASSAAERVVAALPNDGRALTIADVEAAVRTVFAAAASTPGT